MGYRRPTGAAETTDRVKSIRRVLWVILLLNVGVALAKLAYGLISGSAAMQADGFHSLFDGASNVVGLVGMSFAARPADRDHPYGHGKYETYASAAIGAMLLFAAYRVGSSAFAQLTGEATPPQVTTISFVIMIGTLCVNLGITIVGAQGRQEARQRDPRRRRQPHGLGHSREPRCHRVARTREHGLRQGRPDRGDARRRCHRLHRVGGLQAGECDAVRLGPHPVAGYLCGRDGLRGRLWAATTYEREGRRPRSTSICTSRSMRARTVADGHRIAEQVERCIADSFPSVVDVIVHLEPFDEYQAAKTAEEIDAGLA